MAMEPPWKHEHLMLGQEHMFAQVISANLQDFLKIVDEEE
jgi:hypothetical protein